MESVMEMNKLISAKECAKLFSVHKVTWWRWCRTDPEAPKPVLREGHLTRWRLSDVIGYIDLRASRCV